MIVKIQIMSDDGKTLFYHHIGNALKDTGADFGLAGPAMEGEQRLYGFTYLPVPPGRDPEDIAEFRRMYAQYFGG